ncbi:MAG: DUF924 domain-containing protein [Myxococcales bacterium]|nr:DUF924 domain-containing protein [Myxococcales bacterium]
MTIPEAAAALHDVWFRDEFDDPQAVGERAKLWFSSNASFDALLSKRFGDLPDRALAGELAAWCEQPRSSLALVLALDQLPRNLFRDTPRAFAYDSAALEATRSALVRGVDEDLHPVEACFLYLPLEHAEDADAQAESVVRFRALLTRAPAGLREQFESFLGFAERHAAVIERFGRFPHRNRILGRTSTPEEAHYLAEGGETFSGDDP